MKKLLEKSIRVTPETREVSSLTNKQSVLGIVKTITAVKSKAYASNNGVTAFVYDGNMYVTPFNVTKKLREYGYVEEYFYVPFSNATTPLQEVLDWEVLCEAARKERYAV